MRVIAVANHKGGVGKTTTCHNLGAVLGVRYGIKTLLVDLDPQASLTGACGITAANFSMAGVLNGEFPLGKIIREVSPNLYLAPSDIALAHTEMRLVAKMGRENTVKRVLASVDEQYDLALLDCPPSLGLLTVNGLVSCDEVLIPSQPQYLDLRGLALFMETLQEVKQELNPGLKIQGVLPTLWDGRLKHHQEVIKAWEEAGLNVLPIQIKRSIRAAEAPVDGHAVVLFEPDNAVSIAYQELGDWYAADLLGESPIPVDVPTYLPSDFVDREDEKSKLEHIV